MRIGWAGGEKNVERARFLYLYSSVLPCAVVVIGKVVEIAMFPGGPIESFEADLSIVEAVFAFLPVVCLFVSIGISYRGVREIGSVNRTGGLIWFAILPSLVYSLAIVGLIAILVAVGASGTA